MIHFYSKLFLVFEVFYRLVSVDIVMILEQYLVVKMFMVNYQVDIFYIDNHQTRCCQIFQKTFNRHFFSYSILILWQIVIYIVYTIKSIDQNHQYEIYGLNQMNRGRRVRMLIIQAIY